MTSQNKWETQPRKDNGEFTFRYKYSFWKSVMANKNGNEWYVEKLENGTQLWTEVRDGIVQEGCLNNTPRKWNNNTGLNHSPVDNPFKKSRRKRNDNT